MLKELSLEGFKSWKKISNMRLAPITGLFGANSSGKTSILQFLLMLKQTAESPDRTMIFDFGNEKSLVSLSSFENILRSHIEKIFRTRKGKKIYQTGKGPFRKVKSFFPLNWRLCWSLPSALEIYDPSKLKGTVLFSDEEMAFQGEVRHVFSHLFRVTEIKYEFSDHEFGMRPKPSKSKEYDLFAEPGDFKFIICGDLSIFMEKSFDLVHSLCYTIIVASEERFSKVNKVKSYYVQEIDKIE